MPYFGLVKGSIRDMGKIRDLGSGEVWGTNFTLNFHKRVAQKLCIIVLLRLGLVTFGFHFGEIRKVFIFMIFGPSGHVHLPQNQLFLILDTPNYSKQSTNKSRNVFGQSYYAKIPFLFAIQKDMVPGNPEI